MAEKHIVRFWKGERGKYNYLKSVNALDPWTRYTVVASDGSITEYFGENIITKETGQLLPVDDIVSSLPNDATPGKRYLFGHDRMDNSEASYTILTIDVKKENGGYVTYNVFEPFDDKYGVRVRSRGLKNYVLVDGKLTTYDDVDCGSF